MKTFLLLLLFLFPLALSAQKNEKIIEFHLIDLEVGTNVKQANCVFISDAESVKLKSNLDGKVYIATTKIKKDTKLKIQHPFYTDTLVLGLKKQILKTKADTVFIVIALKFNGQMNDEIPIFSEKRPDTIFGSEQVSVADFELLQNGDILLLAYEKRLKKSSTLYLFSNGEVLSTTKIPIQAVEMQKDFRGNVHVLGKKEVLSVFVDESKQVLLGKMEKSYYFKYLAPIVDSSYTSYFFSNYSDVYPAFEYFSFDKIDSTYKKLLNIQDDLMMELYRSEYKWVDVRTKIWATEMESQTGIDKVVWVGANYFTQSLYYEELYAPLFKRNDSLFVFDHYKEQLFTLNLAGEKLDSLPIFYHLNERKTGWQKQLIQDELTGQVYAVYKRAGNTYLKHINTVTGAVSNSQQLHFKYVDQIKIKNNKVYYIYRPFESLQKKFLYEEELEFDFKIAQVPRGDLILK